MTIARSGPSATLISGSGTALDGQVLIVGGSTGSSFLSLAAPTGGFGRTDWTGGVEHGRVVQPGDRRVHRDHQFDSGHARPGTSPPRCTTGLPSICAGTTSAITYRHPKAGPP